MDLDEGDVVDEVDLEDAGLEDLRSESRFEFGHEFLLVADGAVELDLLAPLRAEEGGESAMARAARMRAMSPIVSASRALAIPLRSPIDKEAK